jgi:hypothetical protein
MKQGKMDTQSTLTSLAIILALLAGAGRLLRKRSGKVVVSEYERHQLPIIPATQRYVALGSGERQYLRLEREQYGCARIYLIATVVGKRISPEKLAFAGECIQRRHPILRCRLVEIDGTIVLEELSDLKLEVKVRARESAETCRETFHKEAAKDFAKVGETAGSPHKLWLFQSETPDPTGMETSEIVVDLSHFAVDGSGLAPLLHEVLYYTLDADAKIPEFGNWPMTQDFGLGATIASQVNVIHRYLRKIYGFLRLIVYAIIKEDISLPRRNDFHVRDFGRLNDTVCLRHILDEAETEAFIARCKEKKVSVTTAISAAYLEACAEMKHRDLRRAFSIYLCLVADSRKFATPAAPATDLAPHVYALPPFWTQSLVWEEKQDMARTWTMAGEIKDFIRDYLANPVRPLVYADMIGFFLSLQPASSNSPVLNLY